MVQLAGTAATYAVYNWYTGKAARLGATATKLQPGYEDHVFAVVSEVVGGWAFVGEPGKFVTASSQRRFSALSLSGEGALVTVEGAAGEEVDVCAVRAADWSVHCERVSFANGGGSKQVSVGASA